MNQKPGLFHFLSYPRLFAGTFLPLALILILGAGTSGCAEENTKEVQPANVNPYQMLMHIPGTDVDSVTIALVNSIQNHDEREWGMPDDWVVAGSQAIAEHGPLGATLRLPGGHRTVELCNHTYASMALSAGSQRAVGLPCKLSLVSRDGGVDVIMLNPEAIFALFFHDVPAEMASHMGDLARTVKSEIHELVRRGTAQFTQAQWQETPVGPSWTPDDRTTFSQMDSTITFVLDPAQSGGRYDSAEVLRETIVHGILEAATHEEMDAVGSRVEGLSVDDWRSARTFALSLPGDIRVVELCSPTYATAALSTGLHHAPALPCKLSVYVHEGKVHVDVLDTNFVFPTFFSDLPAEMHSQLDQMAQAVRGDVLTIVSHVLEGL